MERTLRRLYLFIFLSRMAFVSAVLIPFFTDWGNLNQKEIQILQSIFMGWMLLMQVPTGVIADRLGRRFSLAAGAFLNACGTLVYTATPDFHLFVIAEILFGTGWALVSGADKALAYDVLLDHGQEKQRQVVYAKMHRMGLASILVSALVGGWIAKASGLQLPMACESIPFLVAVLIALRLEEPHHHQETARRSWISLMRDGMQRLHRHEILRTLTINSMLVGTSAYFVVWLYQGLLGKVGVAKVDFGYYHMFLVGFQIVITYYFARLGNDARRTHRFFVLGSIITGIGFMLVAWRVEWWSVMIFIGLAGGFGLTRLELVIAQMNQFIETDERATVLSAIAMVRQSSLVVINPFVGDMIDYSLATTLGLLALLPLSTLLISRIDESMFKSTTS